MGAPNEEQAESATRSRLIEAAERLIGERGVADVTVRDITGEAGASSGSIHYHFGTKEGLVRAVLDRRFSETNAARQQTAATAASFDSVDELAAAIVRPAFAFRSSPSSARYMDFVAALSIHRDYVPMVADYYADHIDALLRAAETLRPDLDAETIAQRFTFSIFLVFFSAGSNTSSLNVWISEVGHDPSTVEDQLVAAIAGIFGAP